MCNSFQFIVYKIHIITIIIISSSSSQVTKLQNLVRIGAIKHLSTPHYKIPVPNMFAHGGGVSSESQLTTTSLIFPDETKFCWLNSKVGTAINLLHITSSTNQQIH